jgi:hypothetical protein
VQPLESWRELWVFHERAGSWTVDVLSPGLDNPEEGYVDFAGYAPGVRRLLIAREVKDRGRFRRSFQELRVDDLALVRQASSPELLRDFGGRTLCGDGTLQRCINQLLGWKKRSGRTPANEHGRDIGAQKRTRTTVSPEPRCGAPVSAHLGGFRL